MNRRGLEEEEGECRLNKDGFNIAEQRDLTPRVGLSNVNCLRLPQIIVVFFLTDIFDTYTHLKKKALRLKSYFIHLYISSL